jgi:hypothetical protein
VLIIPTKTLEVQERTASFDVNVETIGSTAKKDVADTYLGNFFYANGIVYFLNTVYLEIIGT